jgi:single-strand DNA-binding protein
MSGVNRVILVGHLGGDPEIKTFESGAKVASFSIATSDSWTDKQGVKQEETDWHNIVLWKGLAEIAEKYLKKGSHVYLEGKIKNRSWEQDGVKKHTQEIVCNHLVMLGSKEN